MNRHVCWVFAGWLTWNVVGCTTSTESESANANTVGVASAADAQAGEKAAASPDRTVFDFLEAVRTGNDAHASELLSTKAREETSKRELVVSPPGSDTARFQVGKLEMVSREKARVNSQWTDVGEDGQAKTDEIVWILKREGTSWRITGMATKIFDDLEPVTLDFEDPDDMLRKQQLAEQEMVRRAKQTLQGEPTPAPLQARGAGDPAGSQRQ